MSLPFWPPRCYVASVLHEAGVNDLTRYRTVARRRRQLSNRNGITPAQLSFPRESDLMHGGWCLHPPDLGATSQRRGAGQEQNRNIGHRADCIEVITMQEKGVIPNLLHVRMRIFRPRPVLRPLNIRSRIKRRLDRSCRAHLRNFFHTFAIRAVNERHAGSRCHRHHCCHAVTGVLPSKL